jgi:uncharacterized protein YndB with AHSA1/START domain
MPPTDPTVAPPGDSEIVSSRDFAVSRESLFAAFRDPARLAAWWGPAGFTNTIHCFDFRPGGAWRFTMHAPDGTAYPNESHFTAIETPAHIVFIHEGPVHRFEMTMTLAALPAGTRLTWRMRFDDATEAARLRGFIAAANEQNFDRLQTHLAGGQPTLDRPGGMPA